jgi:hypothetical protein
VLADASGDIRRLAHVPPSSGRDEFINPLNGLLPEPSTSPKTPPTNRRDGSDDSSYPTTRSNVGLRDGIVACQGSRSVIQAADYWYEACHHRCQFSATCYSIEPERITEIDRIPAGKPVQVEPTRQPDGVFLGELSGSAVPLKQRAAKWK